jgi:hypothetical protein
VEDLDNALFTHHTFFVFFDGDKVGEALVGVFLISVFFSPLALLVSFAFMGWWRLLDALSFGLVGSSFSFLYWGRGFLHPPSSLVLH